jgi:hypothetical protein
MEETKDSKASLHPDFSIVIEPLRRQWKLAVIVFVLILAYTFWSVKSEKSFYQVSFFVTCNYHVSQAMNLSTDFLKIYPDPSFSQAEMKVLGSNFQKLNQQKYPGLKSLTFNTVRTVRENNAYEVNLDVYDTTAITAIVKDFVDYLNANPFFSEKVAMERKRYQKVLQEIDAQLAQYKPAGGLTWSEISAKESYIQLVEKREFTKSGLDKLKGFEVSVPPVNPNNAANMPLKKRMILAMIWGSILSVFVAFAIGIIFPPKK